MMRGRRDYGFSSPTPVRNVKPKPVALLDEPGRPKENIAMETKSEQLANTLIDGVRAFEAKVEEATQFFNQQLKDGHDTIDAVVDHGRKLGTGIARLKAALGGLTNGGPPLEG